MMETERLIHRRLTRDDLPWMIEMRTDPDVNKYLGGARLQNPENIAKRLDFYIDCYDRNGYGNCAIIWKETGQTIGTSGIQPLENTGEIEIGYSLEKDFWGKGIGYESARGWLDYAFHKTDLKRIVAVAVPENTGSRRIMEKLGMKYERDDVIYGEKCVFYGISKDEFLERQI